MPPTAVIVGSGPNGLAAAIVLARAGFEVEVREASNFAGGATRSAELTLPGFLHDLGSAVHPLALASPFFSELNLEQHGLKWIWPPAALAHPFDDGTAVTLERSVEDTASQLGSDRQAYRRLMTPLVSAWDDLCPAVFQPIRWPKHPLTMGNFALKGIRSAQWLAAAKFRSHRARGLFAGLAAHSLLPLKSSMTAGVAMMLGVTGHAVGWPVPRGGARTIAAALQDVLSVYGGAVTTNSRVASLNELQPRDLILLDITPRQLLEIGGGEISSGYRKALKRFRYGPGVFKVDWALSQPIPWRARECLRAATVHLGATFEEIAASEAAPLQGSLHPRPFVLLAQPTLFDPSRAPQGKHTAWAYCHVPLAWPGSALEAIEAQIERFAPGFRDCVLARSVFGATKMQSWNENLVGGDINGGSFDGLQFFLRPDWRRYSTSMRSVYLCSSSTPPGGGVHGMCGYLAAQRALSDYGKTRSR